MARALARTGPTILASGLTVSLAMLVLVLADARLTSTLGPVAAIGVASRDGRRADAAAGAAHDLRPPRLLAAPRHRRLRPRTTRRITRQGVWRRFGDRVLERPGVALAVTVAVFVAGALGLVAYKVDYSTTTFFKKSVDSVEGFKLMEAGVPGRHAGADHGARPERRTAR